MKEIEKQSQTIPDNCLYHFTHRDFKNHKKMRPWKKHDLYQRVGALRKDADGRLVSNASLHFCSVRLICILRLVALVAVTRGLIDLSTKYRFNYLNYLFFKNKMMSVMLTRRSLQHEYVHDESLQINQYSSLNVKLNHEERQSFYLYKFCYCVAYFIKSVLINCLILKCLNT